MKDPFSSSYHATFFWPKKLNFLILFPRTKMNPSQAFFAGMLHGNISSLLQGCNYPLYVYHTRGIEFAVPLKITWHFSWLDSPAYQPTSPPWHNRAFGTASLAITEHLSQFLMLQIAQKQTEEWDSKNCCHGGEVNWWKKPQTRHLSTRTREGLDSTTRHKGRRKQVNLSSACSWGLLEWDE